MVRETIREEARKWVEQLKQSATPEERMRAATHLRGVAVRTRGPVATRGSLKQAADALVPHQELEDVLKELKEQPVEVRREVAFALGEVGGEDMIPPLAELVKDPERSVRLIAVDALGKIGGSEAVQILMTIGKEDPSEEVRAMAIEALGSLAMKERKAVAVRTRGAVRARGPVTAKLAKLSPEVKRLIEALQTISQEDRSSYVRNTALDVLSTIEGR